jgi:3-hydroxyphenylacetate 6-hydroxylase
MISIIAEFVSTQFLEHPIRSLLLLLLTIPLSYVVTNEFTRYSRRIKGFTGPTNWPLVGNIPDIKYNAAEKYRQWSKTFGAVYQIQLGNEPVIVVNSAEAARKLFGGNSQALSSRPVFWTFHKVSRIGGSGDPGADWTGRCFRTLPVPRLVPHLSTTR